MTDLYKRIEDLCSKKGINITTLCSECGIPRASLSDYKTGRKKSLSADTLMKIADYFEVSVDYLYGKTDGITVDEQSVKIALFGGDTVVTDKMWDEVKMYVNFIKERENGNK